MNLEKMSLTELNEQESLDTFAGGPEWEFLGKVVGHIENALEVLSENISKLPPTPQTFG